MIVICFSSISMFFHGRISFIPKLFIYTIRWQILITSKRGEKLMNTDESDLLSEFLEKLSDLEQKELVRSYKINSQLSDLEGKLDEQIKEALNEA